MLQMMRMGLFHVHSLETGKLVNENLWKKDISPGAGFKLKVKSVGKLPNNELTSLSVRRVTNLSH